MVGARKLEVMTKAVIRTAVDSARYGEGRQGALTGESATLSPPGIRRKDMSQRALAEQLQRDQVLASRALTAAMFNELPEYVRSRVHQAIHDGTGYVELRTRIETGEVDLFLGPTDGSAPMRIATAHA
jgi:hypothetical protein